MTLTFAPDGFTLTNLITDEFPAFNFVGLRLDILSGPPVTSISINEGASETDLRQGIQVSSTANQISVNLSSVCGPASACDAVDDSVLFDVDVAAVPEPAAWMLMIGGFGAVGGAMRRRAQVRTAGSFA